MAEKSFFLPSPVLGRISKPYTKYRFDYIRFSQNRSQFISSSTHSSLNAISAILYFMGSEHQLHSIHFSSRKYHYLIEISLIAKFILSELYVWDILYLWCSAYTCKNNLNVLLKPQPSIWSWFVPSLSVAYGSRLHYGNWYMICRAKPIREDKCIQK